MPAGTRRTWIAFSFPANGAFPEAFLAAAGPGVRSRDVPSSFLLPTLPNGRNGTNGGGDRVSFVTAIDLRRFIASHEASRVFSLGALCGAMCCLSPVTTNDYGIGYPPVWPNRGVGRAGDHRHGGDFGISAWRTDRDARADAPSAGIGGDVAACVGAADLAGGGGGEGDAGEGDAVEGDAGRGNGGGGCGWRGMRWMMNTRAKIYFTSVQFGLPVL